MESPVQLTNNSCLEIFRPVKIILRRDLTHTILAPFIGPIGGADHLLGPLPRLTSFLFCQHLILDDLTLGKCHYLVEGYIDASDVGAYRAVAQIPKRTRRIVIRANGIQGTSRHHIRNRRCSAVVVLPNGLIDIDVSRNPVFYIKLGHHIRVLLCDGCHNMKDIRLSETILVKFPQRRLRSHIHPSTLREESGWLLPSSTYKYVERLIH